MWPLDWIRATAGHVPTQSPGRNRPTADPRQRRLQLSGSVWNYNQHWNLRPGRWTCSTASAAGQSSHFFLQRLLTVNLCQSSWRRCAGTSILHSPGRRSGWLAEPGTRADPPAASGQRGERCSRPNASSAGAQQAYKYTLR